MIPSLVCRCPHCGHVALRHQFAVVHEGDDRLVECPACGRRFEPVADPRLK